MITIEIWHKQKLWSEWDYEPGEINQMKTIESFAEALNALESAGESFTLIATKIS